MSSSICCCACHIYRADGRPAVSQAQQTFLINGSFDDSPDWAQPGSDEFNAIAATYGTAPMTWQWTSNGWTEVIPPYYNGIISGGFDLANFLNNLPPGDVNLIAHAMAATSC